MKSFFNFLMNKWVIGIIGLMALSVFIWFAGGFVKFGENNVSASTQTRLIVIGLCWLIWLTWRISQALYEKKQNQKLFGSIQEQEAEEAHSEVDEKSESEALELSNRFNDALKKLNTSGFSFSGKSRNLYQLPWYIIIGPPGSGKTTALVNSGLEFPLAESTGQHKLQGIGGTRHCDWWFTNDAVLIDTAGRYTTQDSHKVVDQSSWNTFLGLLKKFRNRRPINGVLLTINIQDLLLSTPEQAQLQAKTLRTRIDDIQAQLGIRAPVYVMLTKVDLVAGFSEFFSEISKTEREQVWGMTFPLTADQPSHLFRHEFGLLINRLNERVLSLVRNERIVNRRARIQNFPQRMAELSDTLHDFLNNTFAANRYGTTPLLRGVYFSSGTQEGMPIDRMMSHLSNAFAVKTTAEPQINTGKSFFVLSLFKNVIFPESELVGSNRRIERMIRWGRRGAMVAMAAAVIGSLTIWTTAVGQNKRLLGTVSSHIAEYKVAQPNAASRSDVQSVLSQLDPLRSASTVYNKSDQSYLSALGLYSDSVDESANSLYQEKLNEILLPAFSAQLATQLEGLTADDASLISTLKTYLMLFNEDKRDNDFVMAYASAFADIQPTLDENQKSSWLSHLEQLLAEPITSRQEPNERVVSAARTKILQIPAALRLYSEIKGAPEFAQPVDLYRRIGGDTYLVFGISNQSNLFKMPMAYTKEGFEKIDLSIDSPLAKSYFNQQWIWGTDATQDLTKEERDNIGEQLEKLYFADYAAQWQQLMGALELAETSNLSQFSDQLYQLANPAQSPLKGLIELASENTRFSKYLEGGDAPKPQVGVGGNLKPRVSAKQVIRSAKSGAINAWNDKQKINPVEKQFTEIHALTKKSDRGPAPLDDYLQAIGQLNEFLSGISSSPNPDESAYNAVQARFMGQSDNPITKLQLKAKHAPRPLKSWLNKLASRAWSMVNGYGQRHINQIWTYQVLPDCKRLTDNRFPFTPSSTIDANTIAFNEFFSPSGILASFIESNLAAYIDQNRWSLKSVDGIGAPIKQSTLLQFKRAARIKRAFFSGSDSATAQFKVTPTKLARNLRLFTLEVGGTPVSYSHGPRTPKPLEWSLGDSTRARILFEDLDEATHQEQYDGDWAWYRLLASSTSRPTGSNKARSVTFEQNGHQAVYQFVSNTGEDPLDMGLFSRFKCPKSL